MLLVLNMRDLSPNEVIAQMTYNGRKDRIRTYSSRGNGFTVHRSSPTLPLSDNNEATYTELPQQPPTIVWTRKGKRIYNALVILLGLEPRLFAVGARNETRTHIFSQLRRLSLDDSNERAMC